MSDFVTTWTAPLQASLVFTVSWNLLQLMSLESVMPSSHPILCLPLLLLPSIFPNESFLMSQFFSSGGQSTGASASSSVLPMNIQVWFPCWTRDTWSSPIPQFKGINSSVILVFPREKMLVPFTQTENNGRQLSLGGNLKSSVWNKPNTRCFWEDVSIGRQHLFMQWVLCSWQWNIQVCLFVKKKKG